MGLSFLEGVDVQQVLARKGRMAARWRADDSLFSALNLDLVDFKRPELWNSPLLPMLREPRILSDRKKVPPWMVSIRSSSGSPASPEKWDEDGAFHASRQMLLSFRVLSQDMPPEMVGLKTVLMPQKADLMMRQQSEPCPPTKQLRVSMKRQTSTREPRTRALPVPALPTPSANAYKVGQQAQSEMESLKRQVQSLLNKVCPENMATIVEKISAVQVQGRAELEAIIELIFKKAVTEPHYSETYADLVFSLKSVFPDFPDTDGGKPVTFRSLVLNICQNEFEELLAESEGASEDEDQEHAKKRKDRMCANMKFVGYLYLRQLLSTKVVGSIICELVCIGDEEASPEEHALECACELLLTAGYTMDTAPAGQIALEMACNRLKDLKVRKSENGKGKYCKRIQFMIQDVLETRAKGWTKKVFKATAKTKEELRNSQEQASGKESVAEHIVTGKRPVYLA